MGICDGGGEIGVLLFGSGLIGFWFGFFITAIAAGSVMRKIIKHETLTVASSCKERV